MPSAELRKTTVKRIFGKDSSNEGGQDNSDCYVDVEYTTLLVLSSGAGAEFVRTQFTFDPDSEARDNVRLRIKNPQDPDQFVDIPMMNARIDKSGAGADFVVMNRKYFNVKENEARGVEKYRVYHVDLSPEELNTDEGRNISPDDDRVDKSQFVDVEVITNLTRTWGAGAEFIRDTKTLSTTDLPGARERLKSNG